MNDTLREFNSENKDKLKKEILRVMRTYEETRFGKLWYGSNILRKKIKCTVKEFKTVIQELEKEGKVELLNLGRCKGNIGGIRLIFEVVK